VGGGDTFVEMPLFSGSGPDFTLAGAEVSRLGGQVSDSPQEQANPPKPAGGNQNINACSSE